MEKLAPSKEAIMLEEIRSLLGLTIEQFVSQMAWPNTKYYDFIKNGRKRDGDRIIVHPTIFKIFGGINHALATNSKWKEKKSIIKKIIDKNLYSI